MTNATGQPTNDNVAHVPSARTSRSLQNVSRITLDHVWLAAALILLALRPLLTPIRPHDFWWHMATGRLIVQNGAIPAVDQFSYTQAGQPFYNQGWLSQVLMYGLYQAGGLPLLLIVQALVIVLAYGLLLRVVVLRTGRLRLGVGLVLLSMAVVFDNWLIRPQSYALPLFAAFLLILTEFRMGRANRLWLLPLLMTLWVNIHGTFVLGLVLIGLTFVGELLQGRMTNDERRTVHAPFRPSSFVLRPLVLWGALTGLAVLLNPRGFGVIGYVRGLLGSSAVTTLVTEWAPPTPRDLGGALFFIFVLVCIVALAAARKRPPLADMLLFVPFLWLAFGGTRHIIWFDMVALPLLAVQLSTLLPDPSPRRSGGASVLNGLLIGMLLLMLVAGLPWFKPALFPPSLGALLSSDTPVAAVEALKHEPARPQHLFHTEGYGSYLIWAAPEQPVFIDTRIELYPYQQWTDYIELGQGHNVAALLQKYHIDGLLLSKEKQAPLIKAVRSDPAWSLHYEDDEAVYFVKADQ
jgi:hypothetical protein